MDHLEKPRQNSDKEESAESMRNSICSDKPFQQVTISGELDEETLRRLGPALRLADEMMRRFPLANA